MRQSTYSARQLPFVPALEVRGHTTHSADQRKGFAETPPELGWARSLQRGAHSMRFHWLSAVTIAAVPLFTVSCGTPIKGSPSGSSTAVGTSSSGTGGAPGAGGAGGGVDHGMPSTTYPAFHPKPPQLFDYGGPVVATPHIVPVVFANDDPATATQLGAFANAIGASTYWTDDTSEYGVGPATGAAPVLLTDAPSGTMDDTAIKTLIASKLNANDAAFPTIDANTVLLFVFPSAVHITQQGGTSCKDFLGYHTSVALDAAHGNLSVPYVVIPTCSGIQGFQGFDAITATASHELIEAATDPFPDTDPAYGRVNIDDYFWKMQFGGEACDLCAQQSSSFGKLPGLDYVVQRCWSNKEAAALHDPCAPQAVDAPYFNAAPVLPDKTSVSLYGHTVTLNSVHIPVGETRDVEIDLFSDGATSGAWTVHAESLTPALGTSGNLDMKLDREQGQNGEKLHLSIHVLDAGQFNVEPFVIRSTLGTRENLWVGAVTN